MTSAFESRPCCWRYPFSGFLVAITAPSPGYSQEPKREYKIFHIKSHANNLISGEILFFPEIFHSD
jgi:hypothetical protein